MDHQVCAFGMQHPADRSTNTLGSASDQYHFVIKMLGYAAHGDSPLMISVDDFDIKELTLLLSYYNLGP